MIAILFQPHASFPAGLVGSLFVLVCGASGLLTWGLSVKPTFRWKLALTVGAIGALTAVTLAVICNSCMGCDPWWMEWFWICFPAN